jgi:hypothetical protein
MLSDAVRRLSRNNEDLWLWVPAFAGTTENRNTPPHSRDAFRARVMPKALPLQEKRAQGMPDARCIRGLACKKQKNCTRAYRAAEAIRHSLRNGFTAYSVLSLVTGLVCHHHP